MNIDDASAPRPPVFTGSEDDPVARAQYAFRIARENCLGCHEYHAVWGYVMLTGVTSGVDLDRDVLQDLFRKRSPARARILIAGAADDRLLALVVEAIAARAPHITVVDRCAAPLMLCRAYAERHGVMLTTQQQDLVQGAAPGPYDLILVHHTLTHVPEPLRVAFLRLLGQSLAPQGELIMAHRYRPSEGVPAGTPGPSVAAQIIESLAARKIPLPEDEARFRRRIEVFGGDRSPRGVITMDEIDTLLAAGGFSTRERLDEIRPGNGLKRIYVAAFTG